MNVDVACGSCGKRLEVPDGVKLGALACPVCGSKAFRSADPGRREVSCDLKSWRRWLPVLVLAGSIASGIALAAGYELISGVILGCVLLDAAIWSFMAVSTWMIDILDAVRPSGHGGRS